MHTRILVVSTLATALHGCSTVDYTGRKQFNVMPESVMNSLGAEAYAEASSQHPESRDAQKRAMIERVGRRIAAGVERDYEWEFKLFEADIVNAWCLPGGKVGFYTGILPICQNEDGVAAVMGHEIAHAFAKHGAERMTQGIGADLLLSLVEVGLGGQSPEMRENVMVALGAATNVGVLLPFSRQHETEADELGLRFMVRAGYDPEESVRLWERMARLSDGKSQPEFLATHPSPENRAERLRELIPKILAEEGGRRGTGTSGGAPGSGQPVKTVGSRR